MNSTNRFANRALLLVVGLVTFALGAGAIGLATRPGIAGQWEENASAVLANMENLLHGAPATPWGPSWLAIGFLAVLVFAIIVLFIFIFRQGHGRTGRLIVSKTADGGTTIIDTAVAADILHEALSLHPEILAWNVSAYIVRRTPVLDVSVTSRRGASPQMVSEFVNTRLHELNSLLGTELPAAVRIGRAARAR